EYRTDCSTGAIRMKPDIPHFTYPGYFHQWVDHTDVNRADLCHDAQRYITISHILIELQLQICSIHGKILIAPDKANRFPSQIQQICHSHNGYMSFMV